MFWGLRGSDDAWIYKGFGDKFGAEPVNMAAWERGQIIPVYS